jgi:amino acid transporter
VALAGIAWLLGGHPAANDFSASSFSLNGSNATFYGLVILALLGIEVPLNMGVEIKDRRAITSYLVWGSTVVMVAYLLLTFGAMVVVKQKDANSTTAILQAVQTAFGTGPSTVVTLILIAFFLFNTTVYNYSFARLLFVSGLDRRLPAAMGRVNRNKVPHIAVLTQAVITSVITVLTFIVFSGNPNLSTQVYLVLQAAVTVIWCLSMIMLFVDVLVIRNKFPTEFKREQLAPSAVFVAASIFGAVASAAGIWVTLTGSWNPQLIPNGPWLLIVGGVTVASLVVAVIVYFLGPRRRSGTAAQQATA